jgi:GNAT superfamily N-acetyltransferase
VSLLARYDHDERFAATSPGRRREELPDLVRQIDLLGGAGTVIYSRLTADNVEDAITEQVEYFAALGQGFEWKAFSHDQPADLVQRLAARGFEVEEKEAVLVLEVESAPSSVPSHTVKRIKHPEELDEAAGVKSQVYGGDADTLFKHLAAELTNDPASLSVYLAYLDGAPAACGWIRFPARSAFASLWGGSTLPQQRKRGLYTSLLNARLEEARQRGYRYLTVDARDMSRPILEKRGFRLLTHATACNWARPRPTY